MVIWKAENRLRMTFMVLTAMRMSILVFWGLMPEVGGDMFLRNVSNHIKGYMASQPKRL